MTSRKGIVSSKKSQINDTKKDSKYTNKANLYSLIYQIIGDAIITIDPQGIVQTFNPGACSIFGYTEEEVIGRNIKMLIAEPYHSGFDSYLENHRVAS